LSAHRVPPSLFVSQSIVHSGIFDVDATLANVSEKGTTYTGRPRVIFSLPPGAPRLKV
jgi:hypothetical protein